jgi:glycosyltransferase involved in cell wall biosynthesis
MRQETLPRTPVENWEQVRDEWVAAVEELVNDVEAWCSQRNWWVHRETKTIAEDRIGSYVVPRLMLQAPIGRLVLDPVSRFARLNMAGATFLGVIILSNLTNVGSVEVNAFQVHSAAVIQKSIREGFGLTVSEALWKASPTVAGNVGGIVDQIRHGETGWLVSSSAECAEACLTVLAEPGRAREIALAG